MWVPMENTWLRVPSKRLSTKWFLDICKFRDYVLKLAKLNQDQECYDKRDLDGIAVSISIDPFSQAVAVGTSDGRATIYSIKDEGLQELKKFKLITPFNKIDEYCNLC